MRFKCAESLEHVTKANIQPADIVSAGNALVDLGVPLDYPMSWYIEQSNIRDMHGLHDLAHQLAHNMVVALDNKHPSIYQSFFHSAAEAVRKQNAVCEVGAHS